MHMLKMIYTIIFLFVIGSSSYNAMAKSTEELENNLSLEIINTLFAKNTKKIIESIPYINDAQLNYDENQNILMGDLNDDKQEDIILPYNLQKGDKSYDMYALFLNENNSFNYVTSIWRGPIESYWVYESEYFPRFITFTSIEKGVVNALEESKGPDKKALNEVYEFYNNELLPRHKIEYLKSETSAYFDVGNELELPLAVVEKRFGKGIESNKNRDCDGIYKNPSAQILSFDEGAIFNVFNNKAIFIDIPVIPDDMRFILPRWIVTNKTTKEELLEKRAIDPAYSIVKVVTEQGEHFVINGYFIITFVDNKLSHIRAINRCETL